MATQKNEGEGNKTAARNYNEDQQDFVKDGRVPEAAKAAKEAVKGARAKSCVAPRKKAARNPRARTPAITPRRKAASFSSHQTAKGPALDHPGPGQMFD